MVVTSGQGEFSVTFRYLGDTTLARVVPVGNGLQYGQSASGAAYCNPEDAYDKKVGEEIALTRALEVLQFTEEEIDAFLVTYDVLKAHWAA